MDTQWRKRWKTQNWQKNKSKTYGDILFKKDIEEVRYLASDDGNESVTNTIKSMRKKKKPDIHK